MAGRFDDDEPIVIRLRGDGFEDHEPIVIHLAGDPERDRATIRGVGHALPDDVGGLEITVTRTQSATLRSALGGLDLGDVTIVEPGPTG